MRRLTLLRRLWLLSVLALWSAPARAGSVTSYVLMSTGLGGEQVADRTAGPVQGGSAPAVAGTAVAGSDVGPAADTTGANDGIAFPDAPKTSADVLPEPPIVSPAADVVPSEPAPGDPGVITLTDRGLEGTTNATLDPAVDVGPLPPSDVVVNLSTPGTAAQTPEPASVTLLAVAGLGGWLYGRRRSSRA